MTRRSKGEGSLQHILPKKCEDCKKYAECTIRLKPSLKCKKRDSKDFWRYQYYVTKIDGRIADILSHYNIVHKKTSYNNRFFGRGKMILPLPIFHS